MLLLPVFMLCLLFATATCPLYGQVLPDSLYRGYIEQEDYAAALRQAEEGLSRHPQADSLRAKYLYYAARAHSLQEQYAKALVPARQAVAWCSTQTVLPYICAECHEQLALILHDQGDYEQALPHYLYAQEMARQKGMVEDDSYISLLNSLAVLYDDMGNTQQAEMLYLQVLRLYEAAGKRQSKDCASTLNNLAVLYKNRRSYALSEQYFKECMDIRRQTLGEEDPAFARSLNNLANLYSDMEWFEKADKLYLKALQINQKALGEQHPRYGSNLNNLAVNHWRLKRHQQAEDLFLQTLSIFRNALGEDHPNYAGYLMNLALLYQDMERMASAEELFLKALHIYEKKVGCEHYLYLAAANNLADLYRATKQYDKAEALLLLMSKSYQKNAAGNDLKYAHHINLLGLLYKSMGRYPKAFALLEQSNALFAKVQGERSGVCLQNALHLAEMHLAQGNTERALERCFWLLDTDLAAESSGDSLILRCQSDPWLADYCIRALALLYNIQLQEKQARQAYQAVRIAVQINERWRQNFGAEQDKLRLLSSAADLASQALATGVALGDTGLTAELFAYSELNKAALLADALKSARALGALPDSVAGIETELLRRRDELLKEQALALTPEERSRLLAAKNQLDLEIERFRQRLGEEFPDYYRTRYQSSLADVAVLQALLPDNALFLEYFLADDRLYLFALDRQSIRLYPLSVSTDSLRQGIAELRTALTDYQSLRDRPEQAYRTYTYRAHWFYEQILAPSLQGRNEVEHLIVVGDGELAHIPFEAFLYQAPSGEEPAEYNRLPYLIRKYKISYAYSAALWQESRSRPARQDAGRMLAMAAHYPQERIDTLLLRRGQRGDLAPLPAARREVEGLSRLFEGSFLFDSLACEAEFKTLAPEYDVLHLAMHGLLNRRQPMLSALAFSPVPDTTEDNFLEAWEIGQLPLRAELAVLSACQTGYGQFRQGEGVLSLARSFLHAGVPSLVVSLWEVNDASTSWIMERFYSHLAQGYDKAQALRQAQLGYLDKARGVSAHPAYWSAFVLLGDHRPIRLKQKAGGAMLLWYGLAAIAALAGWLFWKRKR